MMSDPHDSDPVVSTGSRRGETHYESDADQLVRAAHLERPRSPLPRQEETVGAERPDRPGEPIEDVKVDVSESSVWDARPPEDRAVQDATDPGERPAFPSAEHGSVAKSMESHPPPFPPAELVSKRAG